MTLIKKYCSLISEYYLTRESDVKAGNKITGTKFVRLLRVIRQDVQGFSPALQEQIVYRNVPSTPCREPPRLFFSGKPLQNQY